MVLVGTQVIAAERHRVDDGILPEVAQATFNLYAKGITELESRYNEKIKDSKSTQILLKSGLSLNLDKLPKALPKAVIQKGVFTIPAIKLSYSFSDFLAGSFKIDDKTFKMTCNQAQECIEEFLQIYRPAKTSFLSYILADAYANDLNLHKLLEDDYVILAAIAALDDSVEEMPGFWGRVFGVWEAERIERRNNNIQFIYNEIRRRNNECRDNMGAEGSYTRRRFSTPATYQEEFELLEQISRYQNFQQVEQQFQADLGANVFEDTVYQDSINPFQLMDNIRRQIHDSSWGEFLTCERLYISKVEKRNGQNQPAFCIETAFCSRGLGTYNPDGQHAQYCRELDQLKQCMKDYYSSMSDVDNRNYVDENRYQQIRQNLNSTRAFEAD